MGVQKDLAAQTKKLDEAYEFYKNMNSPEAKKTLEAVLKQIPVIGKAYLDKTSKNSADFLKVGKTLANVESFLVDDNAAKAIAEIKDAIAETNVVVKTSGQ